MNILALDIGMRRTGIAFADSSAGIPLALDTFAHTSVEQLVEHILAMVKKRSVEELVLGLPLLPSGEEGAQSIFVRSVGEKLQTSGCSVTFLDERYSTPSGRQPEDREIDPDSASACQILQMYLDRKRHVDNIK